MTFSPMYIGGRVIDPVPGRVIEVWNPARPSEVVGAIARGNADDVDVAVSAARGALHEWRASPVAERTTALARAAQAIAEVEQDAAGVLTREMGKILLESRSDLSGAAFMLHTLPSEADAVLEPVEINDEFGSATVWRAPVGVVVIIVPWNWPVSLLFIRVAAALATGNTVICLPSPYASLAVQQCVVAAAAQLPPGVLNLVTGFGNEVGNALTAHPGVDKISFTGGTSTGVAVLQSAATTIKRTSLELGGNDAAIVLDDVVVDDELGAAIVASAFATTGQVCFALKRLYVSRSIYGAVLDSCIAAIDRTVVGDGLDPRTTMGPLVNRQQMDRFDVFVAQARSRGGQVEERGSWTEGGRPAEGWFRLPSLVTGVGDDADIVACEQFGPALPVLAFDTVDEATSRANATAFGLGASVWSRDPERARTVAAQLEAGMIFLNRHDLGAMHPRGMFGGVKQSGTGRELGRWGLESYTEPRQVLGLA